MIRREGNGVPPVQDRGAAGCVAEQAGDTWSMCAVKAHS